MRSRAGADAALIVLSVNVTALTVSRLQAVLQHACAEGAAVVALQETRHPIGGFRWATRMIEQAGFHVTWSTSPPPGPTTARGHGGTALVWRRSFGRSGPLEVAGVEASCQHRTVGRLFAELAVISAYGPAQRDDVGWLATVARRLLETARPAIIVGDLNWRRRYEVLEADGWQQVQPTPPTVLSGPAAPTRCLVHGGHVSAAVAIPIDGIAHHAAVRYTVHVAAGRWKPASRLRRTARYQWAPEAQSHRAADQQEVLRAAADTAGQAKRGATGDAWAAWHRRAEAVFLEAVRRGWATCPRAAERPKGSPPSMRPAGGAGETRVFESIVLRRWRRLHRAAAEQWRRGGGEAPLTEVQLRHWISAVTDGLADQPPASQAQALEMASAGIAVEAAAVAREDWRRWRARLQEWSPEAARAARPVMRGPEPAGHFTAADMESEWAAWWCQAPREQAGDGWQRAADAAGFEPRQPPQTWAPPDREAFEQAIASAKGSGGLDGWEAEELRTMCREAPFLIAELHALFLDLVAAASDAAADVEALTIFWWRVVGIPKRSSSSARPIAVGSVALRVWHRALLPAMPEVEAPQFGGRPGHAAASATVDWLAAPGRAGAEVDLEKAFDTVQHSAAAAALAHRGAPPALVAFLRRGAWQGRRVCHVAGDLAEGVRPTTGIPAGDPLSPAVLAALLSPWPAVVAHAAAVSTWLFVDDRSLKVHPHVADPGAELTKALEATRQFDEMIGVRENAGKRQLWANAETCEHLGLRAQGCGDAATFQPPELRDGWDAVLSTISRLAYVPAAMRVREAIAGAFVLSKWLWAAPVAPLPPPDVTKALFAAVLRTGCTWWCKARFWAERVELHPLFATVLRNLSAAERADGWRAPCVHRTLAEQCSIIDLEVVLFDATGLWVAPTADADDRIVAAAAAASAEAARAAEGAGHALPAVPDGRPVFRPVLPAGAHAARVAARVVCLRGAHGTRRDTEGLDRADVQLLSHSRWKTWRRRLSRSDAVALAVWRGGAVLTPTRRWYQRSEAWCACPWCPEPRASARHLFAECPKLDDVRHRLSAEHGLAAGWWTAQPRAVAKSGWMPVGSSVDELLAANAMGVAIVSLGSELTASWQPALLY